MNYDIKYLEELPEDVAAQIEVSHIEYELSHGVTCHYKTFSLVIKHDNNVIGVLSAKSYYSEIYVDDLWIDLKYRKLGFGKKLLQNLEERFKDKGYNNINLVTNQFQAPEFYLKCGFEIEFVRINKHNPKLNKTFFIKYFDDNEQKQGVMY